MRLVAARNPIVTPGGGMILPGAQRGARTSAAGDAVTDFHWGEADVERTRAAVLEQAHLFPEPATHQVLMAGIKPPEAYGLIHIDEGTLGKIALKTTAALVLAIGPTAFQDPRRHPKGAVCEIGDVVHIPRYPAGSFWGRNGLLWFMLNDDQIEGRYSLEAGDELPAWAKTLAGGRG